MKIVAPDLEKAIAGSRLLVVGPDDDEEDHHVLRKQSMMVSFLSRYSYFALG